MTTTIDDISQNRLCYPHEEHYHSDEMRHVRDVTHVEDVTVSSSKQTRAYEIFTKSKEFLGPHENHYARQDFSFKNKNQSFHLFRKRSKSLPSNAINVHGAIENDEIRCNINKYRTSNDESDVAEVAANVPILLDIESPLSFESVLLQTQYLNLIDSEICSTIIQDDEKLEVIACTHKFDKSRSWSAVYPLDESAIDSGIKGVPSIVYSHLHRVFQSTVGALHSAAACCSEDANDISLNPSTDSIVDIRTGIRVSCTSLSGLYENVDAHAMGFVGSLSVFEQGDISAIDLACEILSSLLRRDLQDTEKWNFDVPVVSEIDMNCNVIDSGFLILQHVNNYTTGVKAAALGYVLFMLDRQEIRVEKYCVTYV